MSRQSSLLDLYVKHSKIMLTSMTPCHPSPFHLSAGGFAKRPGMPSDLLHSFYSMCWLSLCGEPGVAEMDVALGVTKRASLAGIRSQAVCPQRAEVMPK